MKHGQANLWGENLLEAGLVMFFLHLWDVILGTGVFLFFCYMYPLNREFAGS